MGTLVEGHTLLRHSTSTDYLESYAAARIKAPGLGLTALISDDGTACRRELGLESSPSGGQILWHTFQVRMEYDICLLFVFLGTLVALSSSKRRNSALAVAVEVLSSLYLLYATYNRNFIIKHTEIALWMSNVCSESAGALIYQYIIFSLVSWMASSFLECSSSFHLAKLSDMKLRSPTVFWNVRWSPSRFLVLMTATIFTVNSLALTLVLWSLVQKSLGTLAQDVTVLVVLTIAAFLRLLRQLMEGVTLITGIATREFKWRNPNSKILFGRIAFSSCVLLIHSSTLTYTFASQEKKVWGTTQYAVFMGLCVDIVFRLFACGWASLNSCCVSRFVCFLAECRGACCNAPGSFVYVVNTAKRLVINTLVLIARGMNYILNYILEILPAFFVQFVVNIAVLFCHLVRYSVWFISVVIWCVYHVMVIVLCQMAVAWQTYIIRWRDEDHVEYLPRRPIRGEAEQYYRQEELVYALANIQRRRQRGQNHHVCAVCPELAARHLRRVGVAARNEPYLPFPPNLGGHESPPDPSRTFLDYSSPTDVGAPLPPLRFEVNGVNERIPLVVIDSEMVTGHLPNPNAPVV